MSLSLPEDIEPHLTDGVDWTDPGVYALRLSRPDDLGDQWDRHYDTRPDYWDFFANAHEVVYVGGASNVMSRLEDHRNGDKRVTTLTTICEIDGIRNVWWFDSARRAFERESGIALTMQAEYPHTYVHQR